MPGLTTRPVSSRSALRALIAHASRRRATGATDANARSSRSHALFRLSIAGVNAGTGQSQAGTLNLIDLAGSERLGTSHATGARLVETRAINKSLSALGDVVAALAARDRHVPYRNSKLTFLLSDSLGAASAKTLMFVNVNPAPDAYAESLSALRFAAKVNACEIGVARRAPARGEPADR